MLKSSRGKHNDRAMTTLYQLKSTANGRLSNMAASDVLLRGHSMCWKQPAHLSFVYICLPPIADSNPQKNLTLFFSLSSDTQGSLLEHFVTVIDRCEHFSFSIQVVFLEVRKCDLSLFFLLNFTNILFLSTWVSELHRNWFWLLLSREG